MLVTAVLVPAPASASRTLARATAPDLERLPALELAGAAAAGVAQAEPLPLYTFVDGVALDRVAGQPDDQVEAAVGRQRHRLHLVASELARPGAVARGSNTATGVSANAGADKYLEGSDLRPKLHRPSFQGLWTDPVSGLSYARNRWYDARSASWLSEDPMGAVDSANLYAFVGWGPHAGTDPMGLECWELFGDPNLTCSETLHVGEGFFHSAYRQASEVRRDPQSSALERGGFGLLQGLSFPLAMAEEYGGRSLANVPSEFTFQVEQAAEKWVGGDASQRSEAVAHVCAAFCLGGSSVAPASSEMAAVSEQAPAVLRNWASRTKEWWSKIRPSRVDGVVDDVVAADAARLTPHRKGKLGQNWSRESALARGETIVGEEVDLIFKINGDDVAIRADLLTQEGSDEIFLYIEAKFSENASFTSHQRIVIPELVKAGDAGLVAEVGAQSGTLSQGDQIRVVFQGDIWSGTPQLYGH